MQHELPCGRLTIRPAQPEDVGPASVLLTRAFAGSLQGVPLQDGRQYCEDSLRQPPNGVLLVARLYPEGEINNRSNTWHVVVGCLDPSAAKHYCCLLALAMHLIRSAAPRPAQCRCVAAPTWSVVTPDRHHGPVLLPQHARAVPHAAAT